jgi:hypothetical protein
MSYGSPDPAPPQPIDAARDVIAATVEGQFPGWDITHDLFGWRAIRRADQQVVRAQSSPALAALLPFYGD